MVEANPPKTQLPQSSSQAAEETKAPAQLPAQNTEEEKDELLYPSGTYEQFVEEVKARLEGIELNVLE